MPTRPANARRVLSAAFAVTAFALAPAGPAAAEHLTENPQVGGDALYGSGLEVGGDVGPLPEPGAQSFVVADLDTGEIIAAQNAHAPLPPASTLKMLTALTVLPRINLDSIYTATDDDTFVEGSKVGIVSGSTYTGRQLFEGMFLISGNDAANAVANLNGGIEGTVDQMQAEAGRLQAYDTLVRNANGLDHPGQVTSAYDLALMARAGMQREDFAQFAGLSNSTFPMSGTTDPTSRPTFEIWNQNSLVTGAYDGAIGVKSGFTTNAGRTFAAAAQRDGKRYLVTLMGIEGNTYDTGARFLDWAFENGPSADSVGNLVDPKFSEPQSDAATVVQQADRNTLPSITMPSTSQGRTPWIIAVITLTCCLISWWGVRSQRLRAMRMKQLPAMTQPPPTTSVPLERDPHLVDLRSRSRTDVRV